MKNYTALTYSSGALDIGEFSNQLAAEEWAYRRFGADLQGVVAAGQITAQATGIDPMWWILAGLAVVVLLKRRG